MSETLDNDSTKNQLGFEYQKLIALEQCLDAKNGEYIYIECFGDIQYGIETVEVKHHEKDSNVTSNSVDVWKTLKNIVVEYEKLKSNDLFILHTTQNVKSDSIFHNWNQNQKSKKYRLLKDHVISTSSKSFKDNFFNTPNISKPDLLNILDKFRIYFSEPKIGEKLDELKQHSVFKIIKPDLRSAAIGVLIQWIIEKAIDNSNKWEINITDFNSDLQFSLSKFSKDYLPFPLIDIPEEDDKNIHEGFRFIENLTAISLKNNDLHQAFNDYVRSEEAYHEMLRLNPTLKSNLVSYELEISSDIKTAKNAASYGLSKNQDEFNIDKSREVYFKCILSPHREITGVRGTEKFFRNGRIQNINETTNFEWVFKETDL